jgi:hypothetical protein
VGLAEIWAEFYISLPPPMKFVLLWHPACSEQNYFLVVNFTIMLASVVNNESRCILPYVGPQGGPVLMLS